MHVLSTILSFNCDVRRNDRAERNPPQIRSYLYHKLEETHLISLQEALENTRGIGEKIRNDFIGNYNEALKRNMGDSSGF